jgi:lipopolysaccharide biosynthesis protein/GT2 family glycosyltransferase
VQQGSIVRVMARSGKKSSKPRVAPSAQEAASILRACLSAACFWPPQLLSSRSAWLEHAPFAFWLVDALRPRILVELGTHGGYSYFAFCQAVARLALATRCYAVDTWKGDEHSGYYGEEIYEEVRAHHDHRYGSFSSLIRTSFDAALEHFSDASIDLLHIDGSHFYDDVKHDFEAWRPKLSDRGIVLFHDTNEREGSFAVARMWAELSAVYPHFEFLHGHGLGVLGVGSKADGSLAALFAAAQDQAAATHIRDAYSRLGSAISLRLTCDRQHAEIAERSSEQERLQRDLAAAHEAALADQAEARKAIEYLRTRLSHQQSGLRQQQSELRQRTSEVHLLNEKLARNFAETVKVRKELAHEQLGSKRLQSEEARAREGIESLKRGFARASVAGEALHARLQSLSAERITLQFELQRGRRQAEDLRLELERRAGEVSALHSAMERRSAEADVLRVALERRSVQAGDLRSELGRRNVEVGALRSELGRRSAEAGALRSELRRRSVEARTLRSELEQRGLEAGDLWNKLDRRSVEARALRGELGRRSVEARALRGELGRRSVEARALRSELGRRSVEARGLRSELEQRSVEASDLRNKLDQRSVEARALRSELDRRTAQRENLRSALRRRAEKADAAQSELARRSRQVDALRLEVERKTWETQALQVSLDQHGGASRELQAALTQWKGRHDVVLASTSWRITRPLRWIQKKTPGIARHIRRVGKLAWWTATLQLLARLQQVRARREEAQQDAEQVSSCDLFDRNWYLESYPDVQAAGIDPVRHYLDRGAAESRNPSARFDTQWYVAQYADVVASGLNPLLHYLRHGASEGRDVKEKAPRPEPEDRPAERGDGYELIASSDLFDRNWYLQRHPDVQEAGTDPVLHYLEHGVLEGRNPGERFDAQWYLAHHPDVAASGINPLLHYLQYGAAEGREINGGAPRTQGMDEPAEREEERADERELIAASGLFDREWYVEQHPDVQAAGIDPVLHYLEHGVLEGRNPSERFDTQWYLAHNPDVAKSGANPLLHYLHNGAAEGREIKGGAPEPEAVDEPAELADERELIAASGLFDRGWYLEQYPDVRAAGIDPVLHYLKFGVAEACDPSERFDTQWYLTQYPDVAAGGANPLVHYLRHGASEGRDTKQRTPPSEIVEQTADLAEERELVAASSLFDQNWYLDQYPAVRAAGIDPVLHYLEFGVAEACDPSERFDTQWYLAQYPDVAAGGANPLVHYLRHGASEGRDTKQRTPPVEQTADLAEERELVAASSLFEQNWYLEQYPDVRAAGIDPVLHYLKFGVAEACDPSERFDTRWYLAQYPDVAAGGENPLVHYLRHGASEGRDTKQRTPPSEIVAETMDIAERELVAASGLFDHNWYLEQNPDVRAAGVDPVLHYLKQGTSEGRNPSERFDTQWYLAQYPDVAAGGANPLIHYLHHGASEGRDPCGASEGRDLRDGMSEVRSVEQTPQPETAVETEELMDERELIAASGLFDRNWYLAQYPDVRAAGIDPVLHYLKQGAAEGRNPGELFDAQWYLSQYPEVAAEGSNPLLHYLQHGAAEGRVPNGKARDVERIELSGFFDRDWYLEQYPDVRARGLDPVLHYIERGAADGRDPSPLFDTRWYLAHYPDVAARGENPLLHYLLHGAKEGRPFNDTTRQGETIGQMQLIESSGLFDRDWYLDRYPEVRALGVDPVLHYLEQGASEGRNPSRLFDTRWYASHYRDLEFAGWNPLVHYLLCGRSEGRRPTPSGEGGVASTESSFIGEVTDVALVCRKQPRARGEVALFVTHCVTGALKPHIQRYLEALARQQIRPVLIVAADTMFSEEKALIEQLEGLYVRQNVGFDFAAWAHVLRDNPDLFSVETLYLINDSVIGPLAERKLEQVLGRLRASSSDVVGLTDNHERGWHIQSYFLALKTKALSSDALRKFFAGVKNLAVKQDVINDYEVCLTPALQAAGLGCEALFPAKRTHNTSLLEWKELIRAGSPFVKIAALRDSSADGEHDWRAVLQAEGFDPHLAEETLRALTVAGLWPIPRLAVLLHAYYIDSIPQFQSYLERIRFPFTLFISTDTEEKKRRIEQAFVAWENGRVEVRIVENRGRDIAPKIVAFADVYDEYPYVLHLHTKKSSHSDDLGHWLKFLLDSLLGSHEAVVRVFQAFERCPDLGMVAPPIFAPSRPFMLWGPNLDICRSLAHRMGFAVTLESPLDFPGGSMFWARSAALRPLLELNLALEEFAPEAGQTDGTLAHAIERLFFFACELAGFYWTRDVLGKGATLLPAGTPRRALPQKLAAVSGADREKLKRVFRDRCREELARFFAGGRRLLLPTAAVPQVSVILVLHNQAELTFETLGSLEHALDVPAEVIIVDNGSTDNSRELCAQIEGARIIRNDKNLHFLRAVNQAVANARGESLLLLNNDTRVAPGAIRIAHETLHDEADIGAVGGKIILLDGTLQEAGSIVWQDGTCLGYGRGRDPNEAEFQFRRDVDYCSGAFLMVKRALFEQLNGFDEAFIPAYYEETDLCMRIRGTGFRVVYEPRIEVSHFEFGSSSSTEEALELQRRNRRLFEDRHRDTLLRRHLPPHSRPLEARMSGRYKGRILFIDDRVPFPSHGAGFPRTNHMLNAIHAEGWFITFYPLRHPGDAWSEAYNLLPRDVEIMADHGRYGLESFLRERLRYYEVLLVSRPHNMEIVHNALHAVPDFLETTRLIYDAEALIAPRETLRLALEGAPVDKIREQRELDRELGLIAGASLLIAVNEHEADQFRAATDMPVRVIGHRLEVTPTIAALEERSDILFVGLLDRDGSPNVDSIVWFVQEVMPELDRLLGTDYKLKLAGRNSSTRIQSLAGPRIELLGRVDDLTWCYDAARLFIAPTRYAAGLPQKVHEAAAHGLPCVTTSLLARQLGWKNDVELLTADAPKAFAAACARLYRDEKLWLQLRERAIERIRKDCSPAEFSRCVTEALGELTSSCRKTTHSLGLRAPRRIAR